MQLASWQQSFGQSAHCSTWVMSLCLASTQHQESHVWSCVDVILPTPSFYIKEEQVGSSLCLRHSPITIGMLV